MEITALTALACDADGAEDVPTVDTLPEGDAVPVVSEAYAHALVFTGNPVFAAVVDVVPAVVVPLHEEMSAWF